MERLMERIEEIFFKPPLAVARLGDSDIPLEAFVWDDDPQNADAQGTVIRPDITLKVMANGSLTPYLPDTIRFRDGDLLRPAAPFFELWARVQNNHGYHLTEPVTLSLLERLGASIGCVQFTITIANRKAQRRTGSAACAFVARLSVNGGDHERKELLAISPHTHGVQPLVDPARPIPLGHFQVIRPTASMATVGKHRVDLSRLRVRFTPARGEVYGPPTATMAPANPISPGLGSLPPRTMEGRIHEVVPERNRVLNANTPWSEYMMNVAGQRDPQPSDSYDGAKVGDHRSWAVVDDTCDGIVEAEIVVAGERWTAAARVISACPDFAPDRRTFYSLAEDLLDRDGDVVPRRPQTIDEASIVNVAAEVLDLFERAFETSSLTNLDATRIRGIGDNDPKLAHADLPPIDERSMSKEDPLARLTQYLPPRVEPRREMRYSPVARLAHAPLANLRELMDRLRSDPNRIRSMLRPPYGRFRQFVPQPGPTPQKEVRDPRVPRDTQHDMRMPPYLRDSDFTPLSLTWRQYETVMWLLDVLETRTAARAKKKAAKTKPSGGS